MESRKLRTLCVLSVATALLCGGALFKFRFFRSHNPKDSKIEVYESSEDLTDSLKEKPSLGFGDYHPGAFTINVDPSVTYQQMDGFGGTLSDCAASLLDNLEISRREDLLKKLFDPDRGIGLSFLRQPMGTGDFTLKPYSYDDLPPGRTDPDLKTFSIDRDRAHIIPLLQQAIALNPHLKIMATPWSPPGWMKTSGSMIGGRLKESSYAAFAKYFVKFVRSYEAAGIPVYAVTVQNEPLFVPNNYPGTKMMPGEQAVFISKYLGPAFHDAEIKTKIMAFDHNWDTLDYPTAVLNDREAALFVAGTSMHCYGGLATAQTELHDRFPQKDIWETECLLESRDPDNAINSLRGAAQFLIDVTRNWSKTVVLLNMIDDLENTTCKPTMDSGIVTVKTRTSPGETTLTGDYFALGHASKFVVPGAFRIASNTFGEKNLEDVAFRNPDGSIVLVVLNDGDTTLVFNVLWSGKYFTHTLPSRSVATFRWH